MGCANGVDESAHLVDAQDIGQGSGPGDAESLERGPVAWGGVSVEEEDAAGGDLQRSWRVAAFVLEVEQVFAELLLGD